MVKKTKKKKQKGLANKTAWRLTGLFMIIFSVVLIVSCFSYNELDPSYNVAHSGEVKNVLGLFGAHLASLIVPFWGIIFLLFALVLMVWGYTFLRLQEFVFPLYRIFALIVGVLSFSIFLALLPNSQCPSCLGGSLGVILADGIVNFVNSIYVFEYSTVVIAIVFAFLGFVSFNFAIGMTFGQWFKAVKNALLYLIKFFAFIGTVFGFVFGRNKNGRPKKERKTKTIKEIKEKDKERIEPKIKEDVKPSAEVVKGNKEQKVFENISKKAKENIDGYKYPDIAIITKPNIKGGNSFNQKELDAIARDLENVLQEFGVNGNIVKIRPGPVVTLYELEPSAGTKSARVIGLADDIARSMSVSSVRIAVVSGSNTIGIEMPNPKRETVWLRELFEDEKFMHSKNSLNIVLGKDIGGENVYADLAKMPHLLVAGTTGSGKSVGVNQMILSLLYRLRPDECKLIMIDPKMLEFSMYNGIPHLLTPVITDPSKAVVGLKWAVKEMEDRYRAMAKLNVRNITGYNQKLKELKDKGEIIKRTVQTGFDNDTGKPIFEEQKLDLSPLPYIVIVVDEMADLMLVAGKDVEAAIQRLAQMARAAGIHLIMSTQRPSVDVITGTIKANFPTRISFQVTSKIDSRTILGEQGAEQLLGRGDMLYMPAGQRPIRIHGSFVHDADIEKVVEFLKSQKEPEYITEVTAGELNNNKDNGSVFDKTGMGGCEDDLYTQAVDIVRNDKKASTSYIQRKLRIGYNKAASIIDRMEEEGVVSAADHVGRREVI